MFFISVFHLSTLSNPLYPYQSSPNGWDEGPGLNIYLIRNPMIARWLAVAPNRSLIQYPILDIHIWYLIFDIEYLVLDIRYRDGWQLLQMDHSPNLSPWMSVAQLLWHISSQYTRQGPSSQHQSSFWIGGRQCHLQCNAQALINALSIVPCTVHTHVHTIQAAHETQHNSVNSCNLSQLRGAFLLKIGWISGDYPNNLLLFPLVSVISFSAYSNP